LYSTQQKQFSDNINLKLGHGTDTGGAVITNNTRNERFSFVATYAVNRIHPANKAFTTFVKSTSKSFVVDGTCIEDVVACITNFTNT